MCWFLSDFITRKTWSGEFVRGLKRCQTTCWSNRCFHFLPRTTQIDQPSNSLPLKEPFGWCPSCWEGLCTTLVKVEECINIVSKMLVKFIGELFLLWWWQHCNGKAPFCLKICVCDFTPNSVNRLSYLMELNLNSQTYRKSHWIAADSLFDLVSLVPFWYYLTDRSCTYLARQYCFAEPSHYWRHEWQPKVKDQLDKMVQKEEGIEPVPVGEVSDHVLGMVPVLWKAEKVLNRAPWTQWSWSGGQNWG